MIREILNGVRDRIASRVTELKYVDKDWGQLYASPPAAAMPCALVDVQGVDYRQTHNGIQRARVTVAITIADYRAGSTSARSKQDAFRIAGLIGFVHNTIHQWRAEDRWSPLTRTTLQKNVSEVSGMESYSIYYTTTYDD